MYRFFYLLSLSLLLLTVFGSNSIANCKGVAVTTLPWSFDQPAGVAVDSLGNVYVADSTMILKITSSGTLSTMAGSNVSGTSDGIGAVASFTLPQGIAVDSVGNVYVTDSNNLIRKITTSGVVTTCRMGMSSLLKGIAVDSAGNIYVADYNNQLILKITVGGKVSKLAGGGPGYSNDGVGTAASFNRPTGVAVDSFENVYVADSYNGAIRKITPSGVVSTLAGSGPAGINNGTGTTASFNEPTGVAVDSSGNVYVADSGNHVIREITADGVVTTLAGSGYHDLGPKRSRNGKGTIASFFHPQDVAVDSFGNVYVADTGNRLVRKITKN